MRGVQPCMLHKLLSSYLAITPFDCTSTRCLTILHSVDSVGSVSMCRAAGACNCQVGHVSIIYLVPVVVECGCCSVWGAVHNIIALLYFVCIKFFVTTPSLGAWLLETIIVVL